MSDLKHSDLIELGNLLGYCMTDGLCRGFSGMLMQAILAGEEETFWKRIQLIHRYKNNYPALIEELAAVKKKNKTLLDENDLLLLEIPAFYDGIELYLQPFTHRDLYNGLYVTQQKLHEIFSLTKSEKLIHEQGDLSIALEKLYAYDKEELTNFLQSLGNLLETTTDIPILVGLYDHSILLKYNGKNREKPWTFVDTNNLNTEPMPPWYYSKILRTDELVETLFSLGATDDLSFLNSPATDDNLYDDITSQESEIIGDTKPAISPVSVVLNMTAISKKPVPPEMKNALDALNKAYQIRSEQAEIFNKDGSGLLHFACKMGSSEYLKTLMSFANVDLNRVNDKGLSPLSITCVQGHEELVKLLLEDNRVNLNTITKFGHSPFQVACQLGHTAVVKEFLAKQNFDPNFADYKKDPPLFSACQNGNVELVQLFLECPKINVNQKTFTGTTSLHLSCLYGNLALVELLLKSKEIDVNSMDSHQHTPLMIACISSRNQNKNEMFCKILQKQPNLSYKNDQGLTALDIAFKHKNDAAILEILSYAKNQGIPLDDIMSSKTLDLAKERRSKYNFFNASLPGELPPTTEPDKKQIDSKPS